MMIKHIHRTLFFVLLMACSPVEQAYVPDANKPVTLKSDVLITHDGTQLPYRHWIPKQRTKAVVIALHGFNDYSRAFERAGTVFARHGVAVYAYDQRGFGKTSCTGIWGGEKNYSSDLAQWVERLGKRYPGRPIYVLGESMGGAVAINALAEESFPKVGGLILVSPAVWGGDTMNPFYRLMADISAHIFPDYTVTGGDLGVMATDNVQVLIEMGNDPLVIKETRLDALYGLVNLMDSAYQDMKSLKTPVLLLYGGNDQVIPAPIIEKSAAFLQINHDYLYYPDGYHMLLRDIDGDQAIRDVLKWIEKGPQIPPGNGL